MLFIRMQCTSTNLYPVPRPFLPRATCRAAGNRAGQGTQNQESWEDKEMLVRVLKTSRGGRTQGRPRLPAEVEHRAALRPLAPHPLSFLPDSLFPGILRPHGRGASFISSYVILQTQ